VLRSSCPEGLGGRVASLETLSNMRFREGMASKKRYVIDGLNFSTLEEFFGEIGRVLLSHASWGENLDAFNDILSGGFGTPEDGFILKWQNADVSRQRLGREETVRQLQLRLRKCHPSNRPSVQEELELASRGKGPTVFDWLVDIILDHCPGGSQAGDNVELELQ
jgi:RNAse (barnase) inhibitor barstar